MRLSDRLRDALITGHARPAPTEREDFRVADGQPHAPAAVLIAVTDRPEPGVILTLRADNLRTHAGQVALPGGRVDPDDHDAIAAALREAEEEVALPRDQVEIIGIADSYRTFTGYDIMPVLAVIPPDLPLHPHEAEVQAVFEVPLSFVLSSTHHEPKFVDYNGASRHYYEMWWQEYRIWGVTAAIFVNLSRRLALPGVTL
jgi:8-oxo-dGTP pyrophosphatase MutT (NUDIX family)